MSPMPHEPFDPDIQEALHEAHHGPEGEKEPVMAVAASGTAAAPSPSLWAAMEMAWLKFVLLAQAHPWWTTFWLAASILICPVCKYSTACMIGGLFCWSIYRQK